jgi:ubiquinone/menaquinone biosynthesis C-methylase UbiE
MDGSYPSKLRVWESPTPAFAQNMYGMPSATLLAVNVPIGQGPHNPADFADRLFASEALNPPPAAIRLAEPAEPYTLQWFLNIENQRHGRQGRWIPRLLEFAKHSGETLLGLGHGLGTDWLQYARHGASVIVCSPSTSQLALIRRNFELRGLPGRFIHAADTSLPLDSASIDVACISTFLHGVEDSQAVVDEVYRVLKPGGKVLTVAPAKYDADFWMQIWYFWQRWLGGPSAVSERTVSHYSARGLRRLFGRFVEHRIHKRQLRRSEVPHVWRWLPLPVLERLMGRVLVLKAFKPLSAAIPFQAAA